MTGVSPLVHRAVARDSSLPAGIRTLAEALAGAGYRTGAIGHNYALSKSRELNRGFDDYVFEERRGPPTRSLGTLLTVLRQWGGRARELDADRINALAFAWLEEHANEDFFLWLHYYDPHLNYAPKPEYRPDGTPPPGAGPTFTHQDLERQRGGYYVLNEERRAWVRELYDAEVRYVDDRIGRLMARLRELGLYDDSLILFTSDHGEEFGEHGGLEHGHTLYDEVLRVPLLVKLPGQAEPLVVRRPVSLESVLPSVLTLAGVDFDADGLSAPSLFAADGTVLAASPPDEEPEEEPPLAGTGNLYYQDRLSVVFDGWKYIRILATGQEELYDLTRDPEERASLVPLGPPQLEIGRARAARAQADAQALRNRLGVESGRELTAEELEGLRAMGYADQ